LPRFVWKRRNVAKWQNGNFAIGMTVTGKANP
jgi:hypothetical protein